MTLTLGSNRGGFFWLLLASHPETGSITLQDKRTTKYDRTRPAGFFWLLIIKLTPRISGPDLSLEF